MPQGLPLHRTNNQDVLLGTLEHLSPYEVLATMSAYGKENQIALSGNAFWLRHLQEYFPGQHEELIKKVEATRYENSSYAHQDDYFRAFKASAKKFRKIDPTEPHAFCGYAAHLNDEYFLEKVLKIQNTEQFLRDLINNGLFSLFF